MTVRTGAGVKVGRKIIITGFVGGFAYLLSNETDPNSVNALIPSTFIGSVVLMVQFLIDFENRLHVVETQQNVHEQSMRDLVRSAFVQINEATRLFGLVEESAVRTDAVTQMVRHATEIKPGASSNLLYDFTQVEIDRVSRFLKALGAGIEVTCEGEDRDWLLGLTRSARATVDATSYATVDAGGRSYLDGFWSSDLSKRYLQAQREAIERNKVRVRRVFIFDRPDLASDPGFQLICAEQIDIGIDVRVLDHTMISRAHMMTMRDFIMFDGVISYETVAASSRMGETPPMILNTKLVLDTDDVQNRITDFAYLWALAKPPAIVG